MTKELGPVLFIPHGGGPLPLLGEPSHQPIVEMLTNINTRLGKPVAILIISAHWEEIAPTITSGSLPPLIYDYYGFPKESYEITYPASGAPALAEKVSALLSRAGFSPALDAIRGFDHGMFVPLKLMYPKAIIPCIQLSLMRGLDAKTHLELGRALMPLRADNVLIVGSGFSFHNLRAMMSGQMDGNNSDNLAFEAWLHETCVDATLESTERERRLINWAQAPGARFCHPREEHLLPLHVCAGAAGLQPAERIFFDQMMGAWASGYLWR